MAQMDVVYVTETFRPNYSAHIDQPLCKRNPLIKIFFILLSVLLLIG